MDGDGTIRRYRERIAALFYLIAIFWIFLLSGAAAFVSTLGAMANVSSAVPVLFYAMIMIIPIAGVAFFWTQYRQERFVARAGIFIAIYAVMGMSWMLSPTWTGGTHLSNACVAAGGFECITPNLATSGTLSFTFGQGTGNPMYNVELACMAGSGSLQSNATAFRAIAANGIAMGGGAYEYSGPFGNTVQTGQILTVSGLPCYGTAQSSQAIYLPGQEPVGQAFTGKIWVRYTESHGAPDNSSNPFQTQLVASLKTQVI